MAGPLIIKNRYEVQSVLGSGGMGVVYKAFDTLMRRDVALKTLHGAPNSVFVELFYRECSVLAAMVHPNVVEIFDMGEFDEEGVTKPYFVMPLLPGRTLYDLVYPAAIPLAMSRCVDIISQACRGLQAAHDRGLLHRDIKPRNIFVIHDDAVKIIDFGVAHLLGSNSTGVRGTPQYMSPEQITFRQLTNRSDLFSLAAVAYEALTAVHPFLRDPGRRDSDADIAAAITSYNPVLASDLNPSVSRAVAQVVAKAMAKDPWNRFESAAVFADALQRAMRNETVEALNPSGMRIRLERARRSFDHKDYQFAFEIIRELESEGHSDPGISELHQQLDKAVQSERTDRLVESANRCFDQEEFTLALRKIQEILELDPANGSALALKKKIEAVLTDQKVAELLKTASEHLERSAFTGARQAVQDALRLRPNDPQARQLLGDVDSRQKEVLRQRQEQERLYQAAQAAWLEGKIDSAIEDLEQLANLTRQSNEARERVNEYKEFYRRVRSEHDTLNSAIAQARKRLESDDLTGAQTIYQRYLNKYPKYPALEALLVDITERREQQAAAHRRSIVERLRSETDLDAQARILDEALKAFPQDEQFQKELHQIREKQKEVNAAVEKARSFEQAGTFEKAIQQWKSLQEIFPAYPGLEQEIARATSSWVRQREESRRQSAANVRRGLEQEDYTSVGRLLQNAETEFPADSEIRGLRSEYDKQIEQFTNVTSLLEQAKQSLEQHRFDDALSSFKSAAELSHNLRKLRERVFTTLLETAEKITGENWRNAEVILQQAAQMDASLIVPAKTWERIRQQEREEHIREVLNEVSQEEEAGNLQAAHERLGHALNQFPKEARLQARFSSIDKALAEKRRREEREACINKLHVLNEELKRTEHPADIHTFLTASQSLAGSYINDPEVVPIIVEIGEQVALYEKANTALSRNGVRECLQICDQILKRNSTDRLFLGLKAQAETRERELAAEYLEQVEKRLAAQPDLTKRAQILEEALSEYPEEPHFREELSLVRNEQKLVDSIIQRAQKLEEQGSIAEALEQWKNLQAIYPFHPGLENSIAQCTERLRQKQQQARSKWISQIDEAIRKCDYSVATESLERAQREFPQDEELSALRTLVDDRLKRRSHAEQLLREGRKHLEEGRFSEGQTRFHEALGVGHDEPAIAKDIAKSLVRYSREALRINSKLAESMISQAQSLDPGVKLPKDLQSNLAEARKREDLDECLKSIRDFEVIPDLPAALNVAREFLTRYPGQAQVQDIEHRLLKAQEEARTREERLRSIEQLKAVEDQARTVANTESLLDLLKRTQQISKRNSQDQEITRIAGEIGGLLSALTEVRKLLREDRLAEAETLCAGFIKQFPQHPEFEDLKSQIDIRRSDLAGEYLRQVEHQLAAEPDWRKHALILEEALKRYPQETYYSEELALVRNKQTLLDAQIARAREFESEELYEDALREWETLRTIYPWQPGIDEELERVLRAWETKKSRVRAGWVGRIEQALKASDFNAAAELLAKARGDFPEDPRLIELQRELLETRHRYSEAQDLFARGRELLTSGKFPEGGECLRKAFQLVPKNESFHESLVDALLQYARTALDKNSQAAEDLVALATQLQPAHPVPPDLVESIQQKRREAEIDQFLAKLRDAESRRDSAEASRLVQFGRSRYPGDQRVQERIESAVAFVQQIEAERARAEAIRQLNAIQSQLEAATKKKQLLSLRDKFPSRQFAASQDDEVRRSAADLLDRINIRIESFGAPQQKQSSPAQELEEARVAPSSGLQKSLKRPWLFVASAAALLIIAGIVFWTTRPGTVTTISSRASTPPPVVAPPAPSVQIASNVQVGDIYIDGNKVGSLAGSQFTLPAITAGNHVLKVSAGDGEALLHLVIAPGNPPGLREPIAAKNVLVATVSHDGKSGFLTSSVRTPQPIYLDGHPAGVTKDGSLPLSNVPAGTHRVQVGDGNDSLKFDVAVSDKPFFYAFVAPATKGAEATAKPNLAPKPAVVELRGAAPGTQVRIDGTTLLGTVPRNRSFVHPVPPGNHAIELSRDGSIPKNLQRRFDSGQTTLLAGSDVELEPRTPDTTMLEAQDWNRISKTHNPAELQEFIRKYPSGPHANAAEQRSEQIEWDAVDKKNSNSVQAFLSKHNQGYFSSQARELLRNLTEADRARAEQADWDSVNQNSKESLQGFLAKHPGGPHSGAAQQALNEMNNKQRATELERSEETAWISVNQKDRSSLQNFLQQFPSSKHRAQAQQDLTNLQSAPASAGGDSAVILAVIRRFADAYSTKNLETIMAIQPGLNRRVLKEELSGVRSLQMNIIPASAPNITGDRATIVCRRTVGQTFADGTKKQSPESSVTYTLAKRGSTWIIESVQ